MEPYNGCKNTRQCVLSFGFCICIVLFNTGLILTGINTAICVGLIVSSIGLFIVLMCIGLCNDIIKRREERRKMKEHVVVHYYNPQPPIVIVQPDNTYYVGTSLEEHPRPIYTTIPVYVASVPHCV